MQDAATSYPALAGSGQQLAPHRRGSWTWPAWRLPFTSAVASRQPAARLGVSMLSGSPDDEQHPGEELVRGAQPVLLIFSARLLHRKEAFG